MYYESQLVDVDNAKTDEAADMKKVTKHKIKEDKPLADEKIKPKKHVAPIL